MAYVHVGEKHERHKRTDTALRALERDYGSGNVQNTDNRRPVERFASVERRDHREAAQAAAQRLGELLGAQFETARRENPDPGKPTGDRAYAGLERPQQRARIIRHPEDE